MTAIGIGIGLGFGRSRSWLQRLLALSPEALWIPGHGETLVAGRVSSAPDLSGHGHVLTQAIAGQRPLFVAGPPAVWTFDETRLDVLGNAAAVALGTAAYTLVLVRRYRSLAEAATFFAPLSNGHIYVDGQQLIQEGGAFPPDKLYHWAVGATGLVELTPALLLTSVIARWDGVNCLPRVGGVDGAPAAMAAPTAPTGPVTLGAGEMVGTFPADVDIALAAIFARSLSTSDMTALGGIFQQGWAIP